MRCHRIHHSGKSDFEKGVFVRNSIGNYPPFVVSRDPPLAPGTVLYEMSAMKTSKRKRSIRQRRKPKEALSDGNGAVYGLPP